MVHFQIPPTDPLVSLNTMFLAAPDYQPPPSNSHREGYEPVGGGEGGEGGEGEGECKNGDSVGKLIIHVVTSGSFSY